MFTWTNYVYENERYENLRRQAAQERLVRQAFAQRKARAPAYRRALAKFGDQLTALGNRLTERYGEITDTTAPKCLTRPAVQSGGVFNE